MEISTTTLNNIGTNYSIRINKEEILVYEEDKTRKVEKSEFNKVQKEEDEKKAKKAEKSKLINELSPDEKKLVADLATRDAEVKAHESAHQSGGAATGAATFSYQQGPDGKMYAIGGEVSVSMKAGSTPQETIANAQAVIASAMAPADPSGQDHAVAASAAMMISKAQQQISREKQEQIEGKETYKNESQNSNSTQSNKQGAEDVLDIIG